MPTYDYRCTACKHQFEAFQAMSADPLTSCPVCGGTVERLIGGGAGLVFKGSGFYITDYKNKKSEKKSDTAKETTPAAPKTEKK
jgi:putative FmdB family regulatory protein